MGRCHSFHLPVYLVHLGVGIEVGRSCSRAQAFDLTNVATLWYPKFAAFLQELDGSSPLASRIKSDRHICLLWFSALHTEVLCFDSTFFTPADLTGH